MISEASATKLEAKTVSDLGSNAIGTGTPCEKAGLNRIDYQGV